MAGAIERFNFHGDVLDVVRLEDGDVGAVLARLCDVFDVDFSGQLQKLRALPWACLEKISMQVGGQSREVVVLHRRSLAGWLFTLNAGKVRPELREKLATYQREAADVLADHFLGKRGGADLAVADQRIAAIVASSIAQTVPAIVTATLAPVLASIDNRIRNALVEHAANGNGTIGRVVAGKTICARLRSYADLMTGEPRKSTPWKSALKKADNKLRKDIGHAVRAWGALPQPKLGDATGALDDMIKAAHEASAKLRQQSLPIVRPLTSVRLAGAD